MSRQLINAYRADLDRLRQVSGSRRESVLREAFKDLLKIWGKSQDLQFIPEHDIVTPKGNRIYVDGALLHGLRVPFGYWEAKDADDKLDDEISDKFRKGYPRDNIIFSDDVTAVLYQDGHEQLRAAMDDAETLMPLLTRFFAHERQEIADFKKAVKQFALDLPAVLAALREIIQTKRAASSDFARAQDDFLKHARDAINPAVDEADVQEMLIQHILTEDIFAKVFENPDFHRQNNVAAALYALEDKLFGYGQKQQLLKALQPYYAGISKTAAVIESHSEKQGFLKGLYENFYKVYNPMAADRLGVVYTPGEIVRFMIKSADWLCETHFGKNLIDKGVEILDPATGTGTFIVELLEHFRGNHDKLRHKYKEELHANEVAILPYYVANLNIEATYAAITGQFAEYPNLCFVDTLDNVAALGKYAGHMDDMFGSVSDENMARVKRQNERKISVIIGNPPYNAWQDNFNSRNPNRPYTRVDDRIGQTYRQLSNARNTSSVSDMYVRFFRWASDRLIDEGILALITNRSFIDSAGFDGFRKSVAKEFSECWVIDLGGNYKLKGVGGGENVFGIGTGVAISFWVKDKTQGSARHVSYIAAPQASAADKLSWLAGARLTNGGFEQIRPDRNGLWTDGGSSTWSELLPLIDPRAKPWDSRYRETTVFGLSSQGVQTKRDDWLFSKSDLESDHKIRHLIKRYNEAVADGSNSDISDIKWCRELERRLKRRLVAKYDASHFQRSDYRPFTRRKFYFDPLFSSMNFQLPRLFVGNENVSICFSKGMRAPFDVQAVGFVPSQDFWLPNAAFIMSRYRYTKSGSRQDNITDWAVAQFVGHYENPPRNGEGDHPQDGGGARAGSPDTESVGHSAGAPPPASLVPLPLGGGITKDAIFAYCYAVLHDPHYREKYALNLKREFPRIPFYPDFAQWVKWGEALLKLHIDYEKVKPAKLSRVDTPAPKRAEGTHPKPKLKSNPDVGNIVIDEDTQLTGVPRAAWDYRLGNRSAIDWVLDQHKEKTPRDPTIRAKFNTYRFADYKESCIDLLGKVVAVSVETVAITNAMAVLDRSG